MANNKIQFKRTTISGRTPNTTNSGNTSYIDAGEFAVNLTDQKIYSSNGTVSFEVGANVASLRVGTIVANGATGTSGQALISNGSAVFWSNNPGFTGSTGATGFTGSIGPQGNIGFTGSAGAQGAQGPIGFTGSTGSIGYTGSKGTTTISNTAPTSPVNGDTWWNSENGVRYVYYADGTSNQWVQESAAGTTGFTGSAGTNGFTGSTGAQGPQGATGPQGPIGFTGSSGGGGSVGGSNTQVIFNDSGSANGSSSFTFNKTTTTLALGSNVTANTSTIFIGNSTVNTTITAGNVNLQGTQLKVGNVIITDTQITVGNSTVNSAITFTSGGGINLNAAQDIYVANSDLWVQGRIGVQNGSNSLSGYISPYDPQNSATQGLWIGGGNYSTVFYNYLSSPSPQLIETLRIGTSVSGGNGGIVYIAGLNNNGYTDRLIVNGSIRTTNGGITFPDGSNQTNAFSTSAQYTFSNNVGFSTYLTSNNFSANTLVLNTTTGISLNGNTGSAGQVLTSNGSSAPYWSTPAAGGGGGAYISYIQFQDSSFYNNGPMGPPQQSPVVWWDSGINYGSLWFYSPSGSHNANGYNISAITVQDSTGTYTYYTSGTDFSSSVQSWSATGYVVGIYGLSVTNAGLRALMANTASQLGSPAIAPRSTSLYSSQSTITANVSGGTNPSYSSGGRPIIVIPGYSNGYYGIYFNSGSNTADSGLSLGSLTIDNNLGTGSYTYYSGTDFSVSSAGNDSNQQFSCQIYSVSNTTLSTLLNNTIIN